MLSTDFSYTPCTARTKVGFTQLCYSLVRRYVLKISTMLFLQFHKCFVASFLLIPRKANRRNIKQIPPRVRIMKKKFLPLFTLLALFAQSRFPIFVQPGKEQLMSEKFLSSSGERAIPPPPLVCMGFPPQPSSGGREGV